MSKFEPDFHPPSWWDMAKFRYWERAAFRIEDVGARISAFQNLWHAWVSRWPGTLPPSKRLCEWYARRFDL